jgi:hypothetical protein
MSRFGDSHGSLQARKKPGLAPKRLIPQRYIYSGRSPNVNNGSFKLFGTLYLTVAFRRYFIFRR